MGIIRRLQSSINPERKTLGQLTKSLPPNEKANTEVEEEIQVTTEYQEIKNLINEGNKLIFVTGGAGTGKSTFVRWIEKQYRGKVAIAAPTGIAALTVSGVTIHRLCKFPPAWIVDADIKIDPKSVIPKIDILILDEISMVNANLLDAVNRFCQVNRKNTDPFGGLTIIMVGDLFQLPPIVTNVTRPLFEREYPSAKFFAAHALANSIPVGVELSSPFRQKEETLIRLLAKLREGNDLQESINEFNSLCEITDSPPIGAVHLAPRNRDVELINSRRLEELPLPEFTFEARLSGKFSEKQLPAPDKVTLRVGAQIVMLNNSKEWVNGNVGIVTYLAQEKITVKLLDYNKSVDVRPHEWKSYDYLYNEKEKKVEREVIGTFTQIPVALSWAMTIHKSQGLTLDRVHLDLGAGAFETGQTYVALSRSRSISSMTLARKLSPSDILVDLEALAFYKALRG